MKTIVVIGTLDTKGHEHAYVAERIRGMGHRAVLVDVGSGGAPQVEPEVTRDEVGRVMGEEWERVKGERDRGEAVAFMARAAAKWLEREVRAGRADGVISLGGGGGTAIGTAAMRALPLGVPKVMVSTMASGEVGPYVGTSDLVMVPSVADLAGLNRLTRGILARAAAAVTAMAGAAVDGAEDRPLVVASMFGNTTACVMEAKRFLEERGYEVMVFAATGAGGRQMEKLIESGMVNGVLDLTTTEWADEWVGGVLAAGPTRMEAAAKAGVPVVVAPGCLDMVNFGEPVSVPEKFAGRRFYAHNPQVTLMRTTPEECGQLGRVVAEKVNAYRDAVVMIPVRAISVISAAGQPFHDEAADTELFGALKRGCRFPVEEWDTEINDPAFARACAERLMTMMERA